MFASLPTIPADPLFGLQKEFLESDIPQKINLGIGIYFEKPNTPFVMPSVQIASANVDFSNNNYVSMRGDADFLRNFSEMIFGHSHFACAQTVGGTHGVWTVGELIKRVNNNPTVLVGTPTWDNHFSLLSGASYVLFPHVFWENGAMKYHHRSYIDALNNAPENSVLLLHGGKTHNSTGVNPSLLQLQEIIALANEKKVFLLVDYAYFGMGEGFEKDKEYAQLFATHAHKFAMVFSFSKNATLYKHRLGVVFIKDIFASSEIIEQNLENIVRQSISNPPAFGALVMQQIFGHALADWKYDVEQMRLTLESRRMMLFEATHGVFPHLQTARGMFTLLGISSDKVEALKQQGIFMPNSGRINFGGLFESDIEKVAKALLEIKG